MIYTQWVECFGRYYPEYFYDYNPDEDIAPQYTEDEIDYSSLIVNLYFEEF